MGRGIVVLVRNFVMSFLGGVLALVVGYVLVWLWFDLSARRVGAQGNIAVDPISIIHSIGGFLIALFVFAIGFFLLTKFWR